MKRLPPLILWFCLATHAISDPAEPLRVTVSAEVQQYTKAGIRIRRAGYRESVYDLVVLRITAPESFVRRRLEVGISSQNQALWRNCQTDSVSFTADQSILAAALAPNSDTKLFDGSLKELHFVPKDKPKQR